MTVRILEAAAIDEAEVLHRPGVGPAAGTARLIDHAGNFVPTIRRKTQQHLRVRVCVDDSLAGELAPLVVREKHRGNRIGEHHARCGVVTECGEGKNRQKLITP